MTEKYYWFTLHISYADYQQNYYGKGYFNVVVRTDDGIRVSFPAGRLLPFVTGSGIHGRFRLTTDANDRFMRLEQVHAVSGHNHS